MSEHHDAPKAHEPHAIHEEHTKGPHDPKEINPKMASDIAYWSKEFGVTGDQLHEAVRSHGTHVEKGPGSPPCKIGVEAGELLRHAWGKNHRNADSTVVCQLNLRCQAAFFAFLTFAQRAFCAAAILARASGDRMRFAATGAMIAALALFGRPRFALVVVVPERILFTSCRRAISVSS
jgi:hypothetical protein